MMTYTFPNSDELQDTLLDLRIARWLPRASGDTDLYIYLKYRGTVNDLTVTFHGALSEEQRAGLEPYGPPEPLD